MKHIVAFIGSARRGGNSDVLAQHAAEAARETGAGVEMYYLNDMDYQGCQGCLGCKTEDTCVLEDDLSPVYSKIQDADGVIFACPVYWDEVSGQMKLFLDRWYAFWDEEYHTRLKEGKKGLVILAYEAGREDHYDALVDRYTGIAQGHRSDGCGRLCCRRRQAQRGCSEQATGAGQSSRTWPAAGRALNRMTEAERDRLRV